MILTKVHPSLQFLFVFPPDFEFFSFVCTILHKMKYLCTPFVWQCKNDSGVVYKFIAYNILFISIWNMDPICSTKLSLTLARNRGFVFSYLKQINMDAFEFLLQEFLFWFTMWRETPKMLGRPIETCVWHSTYCAFRWFYL